MLYRTAPAAGDIPEGPSDVVPLGTFEEVAAQVEGVFPGIEWRRRGPAGADGDRAWFGLRPDPDYVEVWLRGIEPGDRLVSFVWLTRIDRSTVEATAGALDLVALDMPQGLAYRPGRAGWRR